MPWYVLLIIALASVAFVVAVLAWVGFTAWRVARHAASVSGRVAPLVAGLSRRGDEITRAVDRLSGDAEQLTTNLEAMQRAIARLQVVARTFNEALRPYFVITGWLSGDREWDSLDF